METRKRVCGIAVQRDEEGHGPCNLPAFAVFAVRVAPTLDEMLKGETQPAVLLLCAKHAREGLMK